MSDESGCPHSQHIPCYACLRAEVARLTEEKAKAEDLISHIQDESGLLLSRTEDAEQRAATAEAELERRARLIETLFIALGYLPPSVRDGIQNGDEAKAREWHQRGEDFKKALQDRALAAEAKAQTAERERDEANRICEENCRVEHEKAESAYARGLEFHRQALVAAEAALATAKEVAEVKTEGRRMYEAAVRAANGSERRKECVNPYHEGAGCTGKSGACYSVRDIQPESQPTPPPKSEDQECKCPHHLGPHLNEGTK